MQIPAEEGASGSSDGINLGEFNYSIFISYQQDFLEDSEWFVEGYLYENAQSESEVGEFGFTITNDNKSYIEPIEDENGQKILEIHCTENQG